MSVGNRSLRNQAIPFSSQYFINEGYTVGTGFTNGYSSLLDPTLGTGLTRSIRMTRPENGDLIEAYLFMQMTAPSDIALGVKIGIGTFVESGGVATIEPNTTYSQAYIDSQHTSLTGLDTAFTAAASAVLTIEVNLMPNIPKRGSSGFLSDAFVLLVTFDALPDIANGYSLDRFMVNCSSQQGLTK